MSIGSFTDEECFQIELERMSTAFMSSWLARNNVRFLTLNEDATKEVARKSVELAHYLMLEIHDVVDKFKENK